MSATADPSALTPNLHKVLKSSSTLSDATFILTDLPKLHTRPVCLGPVADLEKHVPNQWWKELFADSLYLKTDGDVVEDAFITQKEIAFLESMPDIKAIFEKGLSNGIFF